MSHSQDSNSPDNIPGGAYDITFEVEPRYEVLHEARTFRYLDLFGDTDEARVRLRELHEQYTSVEFFWWAFAFRGLSFVSRPKINPDIWILATRPVPPGGSRPRGIFRRFIHLKLLDLASMMTCGTLMRIAEGRPKFAPLLPWATSSTNLWVSARSGSWRMPQYDANHFVNATGVEFVRAMASEWSVPFKPAAGDGHPEGWERVRRAFAALHDQVEAAFNTYPISDPRAAPITLAVEMRTLAPSNALLSPGYMPPEQRDEIRIAAPEIVTTAASSPDCAS